MRNPLSILTARRDAALEAANRLKVRELNLKEQEITTAKAYVEYLRFPKDRVMISPDADGNEKWNLPPHERLRGISEARQLAQNDLSVIAFLQAFQVHGIGPEGGKVIFNTPDVEWNRAANQLMARANRDCDYRIPRTSITEHLNVQVQSLIRDGDFCVIVDPLLTGGKFLCYEADQIVEISDWATAGLNTPWTYERANADGSKTRVPCKQFSGALTDGEGRLKAIACWSGHGKSQVTFSECSIFPIEICTLAMKSERFGQYRGNSLLHPMLQVVSDFRDLIAAEIKSAKAQARDAIFIGTDNPAASILSKVGLDVASLTEGTNDTIKPTNPQRYEILEAQYGGSVQTGSKDDVVTHLKNERPAPQIAVFEKHMKQAAGGSLGLYRMFSTLEVSTSYSAARCELWLTMCAFRCMNALLKHRVLDFRNECLINEWVRAGKLKPIPGGLDAVDTYVVEFAKAIEINPGDEVKSAAARIAAGLSNWDIENGAENEAIQSRLAANVKTLRAAGLDMLDFFKTEKPKPAPAAA